MANLEAQGMAGNGLPNLPEIAVFVAVARAGTFSAAGRQMHLSQPAVSRAMSRLEKELGTPLFARHGRATRLTETGQALLPAALDLLGASQNLQDTIGRLDERVAGDLVVGDLVIGCAATTGKYLLPGLVAAFQREQPAVRVCIDILSHAEVVARLLNGQLALGVVSHREAARELEYQPFFDDPLILIVAAGHPWADYGRALPADLVDQPLIMREPGAGATTVLLDALAQHGIRLDMLDVTLQVANTEAIEMAVEEGLGMAFVSESAAEASLALGRIKRVEVEGLALHEGLYVVRHNDGAPDRAKDRLWAFVAAHPAQPFSGRASPAPVANRAGASGATKVYSQTGGQDGGAG